MPTQKTMFCHECLEEMSEPFIIAHGGIEMCEECSNNYIICSGCGEFYHIDRITSILMDGQRSNYAKYCPTCVLKYTWECADCERRVYNARHSYRNALNEPICIHCSTNYFECDSCGNIYRNDEYGEDSCCIACSDRPHVIRNYSDRAECLLHPFGKRPYYYGIELEVEASVDASTKAQSCLELLGSDFVICKEDGSLTNGFEIVTAPATMDEHIKHWNKFLDKPPAGLKSWNTTTCGMHVHINRQALSTLDIGKIIAFVNAPENRSFITRIAGRYDTGYTNIKNKKITSINHVEGDRYESVNITNRKTIEIRVFKGTIYKVHFLANLEFCDCLVHFVKITSIRNLGSLDFINYLRAHKKDYKNLFQYLQEKDYIDNMEESQCA